MNNQTIEEVLINSYKYSIEVLRDFNEQVTTKADGAYQTIAGKMACADAIHALKKQIPEKVIRQHEEPADEEARELVDLGFCGGDVIRCPNCNEYIVIDKLKYCMECGQRLDWNE